MKSGIVFQLSDGGYELHRTTRQDWVQIYAVFADGEASILDLYHGLYLKAAVPVVNGVPRVADTESYATEAQLRRWPKPQSSAQWVNKSIGGGVAKSRGAEPYRLSGCSYSAFDVSIIFADDGGYQETYRYLPELGTALLIATQDDDGVERYRYTSIRANQ